MGPHPQKTLCSLPPIAPAARGSNSQPDAQMQTLQSDEGKNSAGVRDAGPEQSYQRDLRSLERATVARKRRRRANQEGQKTSSEAASMKPSDTNHDSLEPEPWVQQDDQRSSSSPLKTCYVPQRAAPLETSFQQYFQIPPAFAQVRVRNRRSITWVVGYNEHRAPDRELQHQRRSSVSNYPHTHFHRHRRESLFVSKQHCERPEFYGRST
ncbi:hypothetical protein BJ742DRAFT_846106 [Cladochytrium replicatum]|nr:hypothetical protein BJ742DRAFT_846106 [Cladochytrium replicatum]